MTKIEKLPDTGPWAELVDKINEMINAINAIDRHYHETSDNSVHTTFPRYEDDDDV